MPETKKKLFSIPNIGDRFDYISDALLKKQLEFSFDYVVFLLNLELRYDLGAIVSYGLFKNIIVNTASIIESVLFYTLTKIAKDGSTKEKEFLCNKARKKDKYKEEKIIHKLNDDEEIFRGTKIVSWEGVHDKIQFNDLIPCGTKIGIYDESLTKKLDEIRDKRNQIHLHTLKEDKAYTKKDINDIFDTTRKFIEKIKSKLNSL